MQQIVGSVLFYGQALDLTNLVALSDIASDQSKATNKTKELSEHLLDYLATNPTANIRYYASDMRLNIHSDAFYLSVKNAKSKAAGHFFLGKTSVNGAPIWLNGAIHTLCVILKFVASLAAEVELRALFLNAKYGKIIRLILEELGHLQPPTPIHCDNSTCVGIANGTVKQQRSRSMEIRYFWIVDQVKNGHFYVLWYPGLEQLADYFSKHFPAKYHVHVRPIYLHCANSPRYLQRSTSPSTLRGCVEIRPGGYCNRAPLLI